MYEQTRSYTKAEILRKPEFEAWLRVRWPVLHNHWYGEQKANTAATPQPTATAREAILRYAGKMSCRDMAQLVGVKEKTIRSQATKMGVSLRMPRGPRARPVDLTRRAVQDLGGNTPIRQIAKLARTTEDQVRAMGSHLGIDLYGADGRIVPDTVDLFLNLPAPRR